MITTVNKEIETYQNVFLDAIPGNMYHAGRGYDGDGLEVAKGLAPYFAISMYDGKGVLISDATAKTLANCGVLMTTLTNRDKKYAVIVSHDPFNYQQIRLVFADHIYIPLSTPQHSANHR